MTSTGQCVGSSAAQSSYVGVDLVEGPGVDAVGYGHELDYPDGAFDATISGECFEHDPHWVDTFANMTRMTRPGGLVGIHLCFARASRTRYAAHRCRDSPGTQAEGLDYYQTSPRRSSTGIRLADSFDEHRFWYSRRASTCISQAFAWAEPTDSTYRTPSSHGDGRGTSTPDAGNPQGGATTSRSLARLLPDDRYQSAIRPYWSLVERLGRSPR